MIVYRIEATTKSSWLTEWAPTLDDARRKRAAFEDAGYGKVYVDKIDVDTGREALALALNHAGASRVSWPGEEVE